MNKYRVKLNRKNVKAYMKSESIQAMLKEQADAIAARCGDGYTSDTYVGKTRANAMVKAETRAAIKDTLNNNTIIKAVY